ncbi:MAG: tRNA (adenosine(37)-N6)-threonylcarbamoyltransferase complex dimerization subunit type 1 TsaB [Chitinophagales bacterium]|nr:tRNA (adenosine(37)-N6)-threonylcarbamoyltransferase complex dimerization subunit type 1 TsaB [Chitinophagales bacterium]
MAFILNIETSGPNCSIALAEDGKLLAIRESIGNVHNEKASLFIQEVFYESNLPISVLDSVALSEGPGSYTGLRIGASLAKGLCYALSIPLISLSSLQIQAAAEIELAKRENALIAALTDARRNEVYASIYDDNLQLVEYLGPHVLTAGSFNSFLSSRKVIFSGSGASKAQKVLNSFNAIYSDIHFISSRNMLPLSLKIYNTRNFVNISSFEPQYLKLFDKAI